MPQQFSTYRRIRETAPSRAFQSTRPTRGATLLSLEDPDGGLLFQSTRPDKSTTPPLHPCLPGQSPACDAVILRAQFDAPHLIGSYRLRTHAIGEQAELLFDAILHVAAFTVKLFV